MRLSLAQFFLNNGVEALGGYAARQPLRDALTQQCLEFLPRFITLRLVSDIDCELTP